MNRLPAGGEHRCASRAARYARHDAARERRRLQVRQRAYALLAERAHELPPDLVELLQDIRNGRETQRRCIAGHFKARTTLDPELYEAYITCMSYEHDAWLAELPQAEQDRYWRAQWAQVYATNPRRDYRDFVRRLCLAPRRTRVRARGRVVRATGSASRDGPRSSDDPPDPPADPDLTLSPAVPGTLAWTRRAA